MLREIKIGSVPVPVPLGLAPLAGVTDLTFRTLCMEKGAGLVCTEMVSAKAITYHNKNTAALMRTASGEHPAAIQLFGSDPESLAEAARMIREAPFDFVDFNMGCPVPKVVKNGEGSALMRDPAAARDCLSALVESAGKPVTVKIRAGFSDAEKNAVEISRIAWEAGVCAVAVHGRTREQYYSGKADWNIIRAVKEAIPVPVFGNGDVTDGPSAEKMLEETGCDGILIGRAAMGNPWIFEQILHYLKTGEQKTAPGRQELSELLWRHAQMLTEANGESMGIRQMRSHAAWYLKGFRNAARLRGKINTIETLQDLERLCADLEH